MWANYWAPLMFELAENNLDAGEPGDGVFLLC